MIVKAFVTVKKCIIYNLKIRLLITLAIDNTRMFLIKLLYKKVVGTSKVPATQIYHFIFNCY